MGSQPRGESRLSLPDATALGTLAPTRHHGLLGVALAACVAIGATAPQPAAAGPIRVSSSIHLGAGVGARALPDERWGIPAEAGMPGRISGVSLVIPETFGADTMPSPAPVPVPEPVTALLVGTGLFIGALLGRRSQRRRPRGQA